MKSKKNIILLLLIFLPILYLNIIESVSLLNANIFWGNVGEELYDKSGVKKKVEIKAFIVSSVKGVAASDGVYTNIVRISWNSLSKTSLKAEKYYIYRSISANGAYVEIGSTASTFFNDSSPVFGTVYYYKVRAYNSLAGYNKYSTYDIGYKKTPVPPSPGGLSALAVATNRITLLWNDLPNETSYTLFRSIINNTNTASNIAGVAVNIANYNDIGLSQDTTYYYWVKAYNSYGGSEFSSVAIDTTWPLIPFTPTGLSAAAAATNRIDLSWNSVLNLVSSYTLFRNIIDNTSTATNIAGVAGNITNYNDIGLNQDTTYYFWVKAYNSYGGSGFSLVSSDKTWLAPPRVSAMISINPFSSTRIDLIWENVANETGYTLFSSTTNDTNTAVNTGAMVADVTNYSDLGLAADTIYYYWVKSYNAAGNSGYSTVKSNRTMFVGPAILSIAAVATNEIDIVWENVINETSYTLFRNSVNDPYAAVALIGKGVDVTNHNDITLISGTTYYYWVRSYKGSQSSDFSLVAVGTTLSLIPPSPTNISVDGVTADSISLSWDSSSNATGYKIYSSSASTGPYIQTGISLNTVFTDTGLNSGVLYYYKISATNIKGESDLSSWVSGMPIIGVIKTNSGLPNGTYKMSLGNGTNMTYTFNNGNCTYIMEDPGLTIPFTGTYTYNAATGYLEVNASYVSNLGPATMTMTIEAIYHVAFTVENGTKLYMEGVLEKTSGFGCSMPGKYTNYTSQDLGVVISAPLNMSTNIIINNHMFIQFNSNTYSSTQVFTGNVMQSTNLVSGVWVDNGDNTITVTPTTPPEPAETNTPIWVYFNSKWYFLYDTVFYQRQ